MAVALSGDTIVINDGIYAESGEVTPAVTNLIITRGDTNGIFTNMTVLMDEETTATSKFIWSDTNTSNSTGTQYINNVFYSSYSGTTTLAVKIDASNTATFSNNAYYALVGFGSTAFDYQGSSTTLASWASSRDTAAILAAPLFVGGTYPINTSDFILKNNSPLIGTGICLNPRPKDFYIRRFDCPTTIGAFRAIGSEQKLDDKYIPDKYATP